MPHLPHRQKFIISGILLQIPSPAVTAVFLGKCPLWAAQAGCGVLILGHLTAMAFQSLTDDDSRFAKMKKLAKNAFSLRTLGKDNFCF